MIWGYPHSRKPPRINLLDRFGLASAFTTYFRHPPCCPAIAGDSRTIATFHPQIASGHCRYSFLGASRRLEPCWKNEPPFLRRWFSATTCVQPQSFSTWKILTLRHLDLSYPDPRHLISSLSFGVFFPNWMTISLGGWRLPEIHRIACGTAICCVVSMRVFRKLRACKILILPASHGIVALT